MLEARRLEPASEIQKIEREPRSGAHIKRRARAREGVGVHRGVVAPAPRRGKLIPTTLTPRAPSRAGGARGRRSAARRT